MISIIENKKSSKRPKKVLVVEDEIIEREGLAQLLREGVEDIDVHEAKDGLEAVEKIKQMNFHLLITDFNMPKMNGKELIEQVTKMN